MNIQLEAVKKSYCGRTVLDIDKQQFLQGKIYAVLGPNGSGKTTMLRLVAGLEKPDSGGIMYDGSKKLPENEMAFLLQKPYIFDYTVTENIGMGIRKSKDKNDKIKEALEAVGMESFAEAKARQLSGGEAQRIAIARTLVLGKKLVLLDEPTASIDIISTGYIENYIKKVKSACCSTVIFSTHSPSQALRTADEVLMLWNGKIIEAGSTDRVIHTPEQKETKMFLQDWRI